jgi:cytochrome P450
MRTNVGRTRVRLPRLPFPRRTALDMPDELRALQRNRAPARVLTVAGDEAWFVTRYDQVRALLADARLGRSHPTPHTASRLNSSAVNTAGPVGDYESEREDHARYRRMLAPAFSARRMRALRERNEEILTGLLGQMSRLPPPVDLREALSLPLSLFVICELLGVPYEDRTQFRQWIDGLANMADFQRSTDARRALTEYMRDLTIRKCRAPAGDLISDLAALPADEQGACPVDIPYVAVSLLFAGYRTTASKIDYGAALLLAHSEQRDVLRADPTLVDGAVEEILRLASPDLPILRYAREDMNTAGIVIRRGEAVLLSTLAANRDGSVFDDPDRFDITRGPNPHVSFGYGPRLCIGVNLARVELRAVFGMLFRDFPSLRLAVPVEELSRRDDMVIGGLSTVPVVW